MAVLALAVVLTTTFLYVKEPEIPRSIIPGSKLIVYPGTGHIPQEEVAEKSAMDVRTFLAGAP